MTLDLETMPAPTVHFPAPPSWHAQPQRFANWKRKFLPLLDRLSSRWSVVFVRDGATRRQKDRVHSAVNAAAIIVGIAYPEGPEGFKPRRFRQNLRRP